MPTPVQVRIGPLIETELGTASQEAPGLDQIPTWVGCPELPGREGGMDVGNESLFRQCFH